ncbi:MAG: hypothetical protein KJO35_01355, partial [Gammaproteobacteria bacterium]|nr:hypothetical protein [Gammaproteobacteria bacterium]
VIDLAKKTGTKTENPLYRDMLEEASRHDDPAGVWLQRMGYEPTGRTDTVAGETVHEYRSQFGSVWLTDDYIMVKNEAMGVFVQEASRIERGTGGNYSYDPDSYGVEFREIDIDAIMQGRMPQQNQTDSQPRSGAVPPDLSEALEALGLKDLQLSGGVQNRNAPPPDRSGSASGSAAGSATATDSATDSAMDKAADGVTE